MPGGGLLVFRYSATSGSSAAPPRALPSGLRFGQYQYILVVPFGQSGTEEPPPERVIDDTGRFLRLWSGAMTHRMWGFPEIPENLKPIVMVVLAIALAIYLVRNLSR
jgi:hypothetical protein